MSRQEKIRKIKLKQDLDRVLARLKTKSLRGKVTCFSCWKEWDAIMSINEQKKVPFAKLPCPYCHERRGLFVEDKWETKKLEEMKRRT